MGLYKDLTGKRFGRLVAVRDTGDRASMSHPVWECQCDCGNTSYATACNLVSGNTKSCGCLRVENAAKAREARRKRREEPH